MRLAYLLDCYGELFDEHSKNIMKLYYEDDLSLAEIAEGEKISRQGVRHIIKKCEEELEFFESRLQLAKKLEKSAVAKEIILEVAKELNSLSDERLSDFSERLNTASKMLDG